MRSCLVWFALFTVSAAAQQTVAPTPEAVGPPRGDNAGGYNVVNSVELGYRFRDVNGDLGKYRSDVNFGQGLRLLGSNVMVNSRDGHGWLFDTLTLQTQGLGNDPYESASLRIEKNGIYQYNLMWRLQDYFNPALTIAGGAHFMDTQRRMQDHDLTLFPRSRVKFFVGYSRNAQEGPALSSTLLFNASGNEFPLFSDVRRLENEYRLGAEISLFGFRLNVLHGWVRSSETTPFGLNGAGLDPSNSTTLSQFNRVAPYRSSSPYWRLNLRREEKNWVVGARYTYAGTRGDFLLDETAVGLDRLGAAQNRQTAIVGSGLRAVATGDLTVTVFPVSGLAITNQTSFYNTRMNGNNLLSQIDNATLATQLLSFQLLDIRTIVNATDANWRAAKWIVFYGGYHYSTRRADSVLGQISAGVPASLSGELNNELHSGLAGIRLQPVRPLSVKLDAEMGRASHPFFSVGEKNYHLLGARLEYKTRTLLLSASARSNYNVNSVSLANYSSRGRNYSANASWTPRSWFSLDATYSKIHLDTLGALAYFAAGNLVTGDHSLYISNIHFGNIMARFALGRRVELSAGYSRIQDVGDGRSSQLGNQGGSALPAFLAAQTFPLTFESPLARLSVKLHERVRWNAGWQFYHYRERFQGRVYDANTGYTSVLWSF
jgi:hypothetical protein